MKKLLSIFHRPSIEELSKQEFDERIRFFDTPKFENTGADGCYGSPKKSVSRIEVMENKDIYVGDLSKITINGMPKREGLNKKLKQIESSALETIDHGEMDSKKQVI